MSNTRKCRKFYNWGTFTNQIITVHMATPVRVWLSAPRTDQGRSEIVLSC